LEKEQSEAKAEAEAGVTALTTPGRGQHMIERSDRPSALGENRVKNVISQFLLSSDQVPCTQSPLLPEGEPPALCNVRLKGPVRSALIASGSHHARIIRTLEQEFIDNNSSSVRGRSRRSADGVKIMSEADILTSEHIGEHSEEYLEEHFPENFEGITVSPMEHSRSDHENESAKGREKGMQGREGPGHRGGEGSLYTAVMTNPPFYDDFEEVC
jgi:hypothetical protein